MNEIKEKIERMKIKAEIILKENKKAFIKDVNDTYFFCKILIVGEERISFKPFKGNNYNETVRKFWADISEVDEYREVRE